MHTARKGSPLRTASMTTSHLEACMPTRRRFGSVRSLASGRWQARYWDAAGNRLAAPETFATKATHNDGCPQPRRP